MRHRCCHEWVLSYSLSGAGGAGGWQASEARKAEMEAEAAAHAAELEACARSEFNAERVGFRIEELRTRQVIGACGGVHPFHSAVMPSSVRC